MRQVDERREIKAAAIIGSRVLALVALAGLVWGLRTDYVVLQVLAGVVVLGLLLFAFTGTLVVAGTLRNSLGRQLGLRGKLQVQCLGWGILLLLLVVLWRVFDLLSGLTA